MLSYEVYKITHIAIVFIFLTTLAAELLGGNQSKWVKMVVGMSSFLIIVTGMGLAAVMGVFGGGEFPLWLKGKVLFWGALAMAAPICGKYLVKHRAASFWGLLVLALLAVSMAIYKFI